MPNQTWQYLFRGVSTDFQAFLEASRRYFSHESSSALATHTLCFFIEMLIVFNTMSVERQRPFQSLRRCQEFLSLELVQVDC